MYYSPEDKKLIFDLAIKIGRKISETQRKKLNEIKNQKIKKL